MLFCFFFVIGKQWIGEHLKISISKDVASAPSVNLHCVVFSWHPDLLLAFSQITLWTRSCWFLAYGNQYPLKCPQKSKCQPFIQNWLVKLSCFRQPPLSYNSAPRKWARKEKSELHKTHKDPSGLHKTHSLWNWIQTTPF